MAWIKSSACGEEPCIEIAAVQCIAEGCDQPSGHFNEVLIRNSDITDRALRFTGTQWLRFVAGVRAGDFDHLGREAIHGMD